METKDIDGLIRQIEKLSKSEREKFLKNLSEVTFDFKVNKSFLNPEYQHPITIRKEVYDFMDIHGVSTTDNAAVIFPDGTVASGYIRRGKTTQRGIYYQIRIRGGLTGIAEMKLGDIVTVEIEKNDGRIAVKIRRKNG